MMPSCDRPRSMQPFIAAQMRSSPASSSARDINVSSLARFISAIDRPLAAAMSSISAALAKG